VVYTKVPDEPEPFVVEAFEDVAVKGATEEPATEQVERKADWATLTALPLHMLAIASWTSSASLPQTEERSLGSSCVLTALMRHAGGTSARTLAARAKRGRMNEVFIVTCLVTRALCLGN